MKKKQVFERTFLFNDRPQEIYSFVEEIVSRFSAEDLGFSKGEVKLFKHIKVKITIPDKDAKYDYDSMNNSISNIR
jgi:hypothetical protein